MNSWMRAFAVGCVTYFFVFGVACERKPAQPAKSPPSPPAAPTRGNNMQKLAEFLEKEKSTPRSASAATSKTASSSGQPAGHPPPGAPSQMAGQGNDGVVPLKYDAPATWTSQPPSSAMRKAQFLLPRATGDTEDGQMIVFQFGKGQGGAVEMNIQRWVGMFTTKDGQPISGDAVKRETREVGGLKITTLNVSGNFADAMMGMSSGTPKENYRMLAAIVETPDGPWFFKGVGPEATMASHREGFEKLLGTVRR